MTSDLDTYRTANILVKEYGAKWAAFMPTKRATVEPGCGAGSRHRPA
jgi:hypothetical protein